MRVCFLVADLDGGGAAERGVAARAGALVDLARTDPTDDTEGTEGTDVAVAVVSLRRTADEPAVTLDDAVRVTYVVDERGDHPVAAAASDDLAGLPPRLVLPEWDPELHRLHEVALAALLGDLDADVLVTTSPALLALAARLAPPHVALVHQELRVTSSREDDLPALLTHAAQADLVTLLTDDQETWFRLRLGGAAPRTAVLPDPLPDRWRPRSRLDRPLVVAAGRFGTEERWPLLIQAFAELADRRPEWRLRIHGDGPRRAGLLALGRQLGLGDRLELPGAVADLAEEWPRASITALCSATEGEALLITESMAAGVPVVALDSPAGAREVVTDGHDGVLVQDGSIGGFAHALLRLADDETERQRFGAHAVTTASGHDARTVARSWRAALEAAVADRAGRSTPAAPAVPSPDLPPPDIAPLAPVTPDDLRRESLRWLAGAAEECAPGWFVLPPRLGEPPVVVVPHAHRRAFWERLAVDPPAWASLRQPETRGWRERRHPVAEGLRDLARGAPWRLVVEPWPLDGDGEQVRRPGSDVHVQVWDTDADGRWSARQGNRFVRTALPDGPRVPVQVLGLEVPTLPEAAWPLVEEVRFDVDAVLTWVDDADPVWAASRAAAQGQAEGLSLNADASGAMRYRDQGELRHALRSLHQFAPWVRRIHLVTAGQCPDWLDRDHPSIRLVDHTEILPASALPTFNSHAIEARLHHVPDLAEHFVYLNDDMMLMAPLGREHFFTSGGLSRVFQSTTLIGTPGASEPAYRHAAVTNRRLLEREFGVTLTRAMAHTPYPHRRSVLEDIERRFPAELEATAHSRFRSGDDVSLLSSLAQHYGLLTGTAVLAEPRLVYVELDSPNLGVQLRRAAGRLDVDFACLADQDGPRPTGFEEALEAFWDTCFPAVAAWELPGR